MTDGRLSGASGKIPSAIHVSPEAVRGGAIFLVRDWDLLRLDCTTGTLEGLTDMKNRQALALDTERNQQM